MFSIMESAFCQETFAEKVTRGPYLQLGTPTSIVMRWRTDRPTTSRVRYGKDLDRLDGTADSPGETKEHIVRVGPLSPNTKYFYAVGSAEGFFTTSPPAGKGKPTRIWAIGDSGSANQDQKNVRDAYLAFTGARATDVWLMLGDNAYEMGADSQYQAAVFDLYPTLLRHSVLWPALGNGDAKSADSSTQSGVYYDIFTLPTEGQAGGEVSATEAYYSFDYGDIHFICLNSHDSDRSKDGRMMAWLQRDLIQAKNRRWLIAYWHHVPYSKGSCPTDAPDKKAGSRCIEMRENFLPVLEEAGVDLVLGGHSHVYERSFLMDGHYGISTTLTKEMIKDRGNGREDGDGVYHKPLNGNGVAPHGGTVYAVVGSSGKTAGGPLDHPAMCVSLNVLGSLVVDIDGDRLDARFITDKGAQQDHFTIIKS